MFGNCCANNFIFHIMIVYLLNLLIHCFIINGFYLYIKMLDKVELWKELTQSSTLLHLENIKMSDSKL